VTGNQSNELSDEQRESEIEDLNALLSDIINTSDFVLEKVENYKKEASRQHSKAGEGPSSSNASSSNEINDSACVSDVTSSEEIYVEKMSELQFGEFS